MIDSSSVSAGLKLWLDGFASVAQLVEQLTLNQLVHGSSPCRGTTFKAPCESEGFFISGRYTAGFLSGQGMTEVKNGPLSQVEFAFAIQSALLEKPRA